MEDSGRIDDLSDVDDFNPSDDLALSPSPKSQSANNSLDNIEEIQDKNHGRKDVFEGI